MGDFSKTCLSPLMGGFEEVAALGLERGRGVGGQGGTQTEGGGGLLMGGGEMSSESSGWRAEDERRTKTSG